MNKKPFDPTKEGVRTDFRKAMSYGDYLNLDVLLRQQNCISDAHDEMLFIVQHQTSELWLKQILHEMLAARSALEMGNMASMMKMLARVSRIFEQLNNQWDVLRTMTPADYTHFRDALGPSSGFQSYQYRMVEFILGNRNPAMIKPHAHISEIQKMLQMELSRTSFYDEVVRFLFKTLDGSIKKMPLPQLNTPHEARTEIQERWKIVYQNVDRYWNLYELAEKLMDLEDYFRRWRFNHVTTVERVIGFKRGTGGTSGVKYLKQMLDVELFPELWHLRGEL